MLLLLATTLAFAARSIQTCTICESCSIPSQFSGDKFAPITEAFPSSEWLLATCNAKTALINIHGCFAEDWEDALNDPWSTIQHSDMECNITTVDGKNQMEYSCDVKETGSHYTGSIIAADGGLQCKHELSPSLSARKFPGPARQTSSLGLRSLALNMTSMLPTPTPTPMPMAPNSTTLGNFSCTGTDQDPFPPKGALDNCRHPLTSDGSSFTCRTLMREVVIGLGVYAVLVLLDFLDVSWGL
ncbi:hypothetical protein GGR57DRAFT_373316 [Xylariaceae sp. FL1272]|nr:hypothetical protein GGR57DRAFT_373316 [Xylariaceae sp. FL1272]